MNPAEYARMHALEDWYWWFVARRKAAARFIRDYAPVARPLHILDAGCGTGGMLDLYREWANEGGLNGEALQVTGVDFSPEALRFSSQRGHDRLVGGDLTQLPFRTGEFDVVSALDVIEHVPDDAAAMQEIARVLRPGGLLVATVPAYQILWSAHDEALHHQRRYTGAQFQQLIRNAGLHVEKQTYLLAALLPVAAAIRLAQRKKTGNHGLETGSEAEAPGGEKSGQEATVPQVSPLVNQTLLALQAAELAVARRVSLPFGLTVLAVARKPVPVRVKAASIEEALAVGARPQTARR